MNIPTSNNKYVCTWDLRSLSMLSPSRLCACHAPSLQVSMVLITDIINASHRLREGGMLWVWKNQNWTSIICQTCLLMEWGNTSSELAIILSRQVQGWDWPGSRSSQWWELSGNSGQHWVHMCTITIADKTYQETWSQKTTLLNNYWGAVNIPLSCSCYSH